jgi:hypothetical protein
MRSRQRCSQRHGMQGRRDSTCRILPPAEEEPLPRPPTHARARCVGRCGAAGGDGGGRGGSGAEMRMAGGLGRRDLARRPAAAGGPGAGTGGGVAGRGVDG